MKSINPYLNFQGNTEEAFNFYKKVFGGDFVGGINRFTNAPDTENLTDADKKKVMHIGLQMGENNFIMATDSLESMGFKVTLLLIFYGIIILRREIEFNYYQGNKNGKTNHNI